MLRSLSVVVKTSIFLLTLQGTLCLRNVHLVVPESVERGSRVEMKCVYDLEQEVLYTVKWYRGDREFCRYSPRDVPPLKIFRIPGIEVDRLATDAQRLTIEAATRTANGRYTCEVSADAPSFQTAQVHAHMYVVVVTTRCIILRVYRTHCELLNGLTEFNGIVSFGAIAKKIYLLSNGATESSPAIDAALQALWKVGYIYLPNSGPEMQGLKQYYRTGMKLKVECASFNSLPAANLSFFINSEPAHKQHVWHRVSPANGSLWNAFSTIQFVVQKHHFIRGKMKIRCTANIYSIYLKSNEQCALEERPPTTPVSLPEINEVVLYPIHRMADTSDCASRIISTSVTALLITFWCMSHLLEAN